MQGPKAWKYRKAHKGRMRKGVTSQGGASVQALVFGDAGLVALEPGKISARQLEAGRRALRRSLQRKGQVWRRVFPSVPVTSKPVSVRRGRGKGSFSYWVVRVRAGTRLYESGGDITRAAQSEALRSAGAKINVQTTVVTRREVR